MELKAAIKPAAPPSEREAREWADQMHQLREGRMSQFSAFSREDLRAMEAACPSDTVRDLVQHGTVQSPSGAGVSGTITRVSNNPGIGGTGWRDATPIGPPPGINLIDSGVNAALPHGPEWGKKEGRDG